MAGKSASQVPISKHPAFPAIVALWFAALLGIGSLVLPASLFEAATGASGIASVLPAAEPPFGVTARILIALVAATLGVVAGLFVARKVVAAQNQPPRAPREARAALSAKRPILAHEELWSEGFDEPVEDARPAPIAGRRRALSVTDESGPSTLLDSALLPDGETEIAFAQTPSAPPSLDAPAAEAVEDDPLELAAFAESEAVATHDAEFGHDTPVTLELAAEARAEPEPEFAAEAASEPAISSDAARPFDAPLDVSTSPAPPTALPETEVRTSAEPVQLDDPHEFAGSEPETPPAEDAARTPALGDLSIAELVERFALSLQQAAERVQAEAETLAQAADDDEAEPLPRYVPDLGVEAVEAPRFAPPAEPEMAAVEQPVEEPAPDLADEPATHVPAALRPVAFGDDYTEEDDGEGLPLTLSFAPESRPFDRPLATSAPAAAESVGDATDETEHGYSSLLNMRKQVSAREFVRIEDETPAGDAAADEAIEPIVVFPGQEQRRAAPPADPAPADRSTIGRLPDGGAAETASVERPFAAPASIRGATDPMQTERALREALHKLQRLSGAA